MTIFDDYDHYDAVGGQYGGEAALHGLPPSRRGD